MRSFAEYRRAQLKEAIRQACFEESIQKQFDILRIDLLEAIKLPAKPQGNILAEVQYNQARKQDYAQNSYFVEQFIQVCKEDFYDEIMAEAADASSSLQQMKSALMARIKKFTTDLRAAIGAAAGGTRDMAAPDTPASGAGAPAPAPASGAGAPAPAPGGQSEIPNWSAGRGEPRPQGDGGFQPATMGSIRPSDGFLGGMGRLFRRATRPIRRVWHGDPNREMAKEHIENLQTIFNENADGVETIIAAFEKDMAKLIDARVRDIVTLLGGGTPAAPDASAPPQDATATIDASMDQVDKEAEDQADAAKELALRNGASPEEAEAEGQQYLKLAVKEMAQKGASILGVEAAPKGGWKVAGSEEMFGGWGASFDKIALMVFEQLKNIDPRLGQEIRKAEFTSGNKPRQTNARKLALVRQTLKIGGGRTKENILNLLARFGKAYEAFEGQSLPDWNYEPIEKSARKPRTPKAPQAPVEGDPSAETGPPSDQVPVGGDVDNVSADASPVQSAIAYIKSKDPGLFKFLSDSGESVEELVQAALDGSDVEGAYAALKELQPEEELERSAPPTEQPPADAEQPPVDTEQPPVDTEQPPADAEQPPVDTEQPAETDASVFDPNNPQAYIQHYISQIQKELGAEGAPISSYWKNRMARVTTEDEADGVLGGYLKSLERALAKKKVAEPEATAEPPAAEPPAAEPPAAEPPAATTPAATTPIARKQAAEPIGEPEKRFEPHAQHANPADFFDQPEDEEGEGEEGDDYVDEPYVALGEKYPKLRQLITQVSDHMSEISPNDPNAGDETFKFIMQHAEDEEDAQKMLNAMLGASEGDDDDIEDADQHDDDLEGETGDFYDDPDEAIRRRRMREEAFRQKIDNLKAKLLAGQD